MKISKSKQELARIISENGWWAEHCEWAVQDKSGEFGENSVILFEGRDKPIINSGRSEWVCAEGYESDSTFGKHVCNSNKLVKNWHQTILSRAEYFHLYPAPDAKVNVAVENNTSLNVTVSDKPTIEQLAADYRNAKDYAERKQQEADAAKADADAKLKELELAGEAIGLLVSPIAEKHEPELVITDWRDLMSDDVISIHCFDDVYSESKVIAVGCDDVLVKHHTGANRLVDLSKKHWEFIRRP